MALYHKHRPKIFSDVISNKNTIQILQRIVEDQPCEDHAFMFTGQRGCGKTSVGRILAQELGCCGNDYQEINAADFRGIDTVRAVRKQANYKPLEGSCRVWLFDEFHLFGRGGANSTNEAQNAMLKLLEDPPATAYFILCTTDPQKVLGPIKDRCLQFKMESLNDSQMLTLLRRATKGEGAQLKKNVYEHIIDNSYGNPRLALQTLAKVLKTDLDDQEDIAKQSADAEAESVELCRALINQKSWKAVATIIAKLRKEQTADDVRGHIRNYCTTILLQKGGTQPFRILAELEEPRYAVDWPSLALACWAIINTK